MLETDITKLIDLYRNECIDIFSMQTFMNDISVFVQEIIASYEAGVSVFVCGNGGNAAYIANLVTDLNIHPFVSDDKSVKTNFRKTTFRCFDLCAQPALLTGIMNDMGAQKIFSEQLEFLGTKNDVLICMTGSGSSKNILDAAKFAQKKQMRVIAITRNHFAPVYNFANVSITVPGKSQFPGQIGKNNNNFHYEDFLSKMTHIACGILRKHVRDSSK